MRDPEPRTVTPTVRVMVAAGLATFLMIALLAGQLTFIVMQRDIVDHQREIAARQEKRSAQVLETTRALIGTPEGARRAVSRAAIALDELEGLLVEVRRTDVIDVAVQALRRAPDLLRDVDHAVRVLDRTYPTLRRSLDVQTDTRNLTDTAVDFQRQTLEIQRRTLEIQRETLALQRRAVGLTAEIRDIARSTLTRVESIDNKTGGPAPGAAPLP